MLVVRRMPCPKCRLVGLRAGPGPTPPVRWDVPSAPPRWGRQQRGRGISSPQTRWRAAAPVNPGPPALPAHFSELVLAVGQLRGESRRLANALGNRPSNRLIAVRVKVNFGLVRVAARLQEGMGRQGTRKEELGQSSCSSVAERLMWESGGNKTFWNDSRMVAKEWLVSRLLLNGCILN